jgi:hypothetical protein
MKAIVGWQRVRAGRYRHESGAQVYHAAAQGSEWVAELPTGEAVSGHQSMQDAMHYAQQQEGGQVHSARKMA